MKLKQFLSGIFALLFVVSLPVSALAADWDIGNGDITVNAGSGGQTVTQGSQVDVPDSAPVITGTSKENNVTINAEKDQTANVTLSGANIDVSSAGKAAVSTTGEGNVSIELNGSNALKSGHSHAGLEKNNDGNLTIQDKDKDGSLNAKGGQDGAGIGGGSSGAGSDITITGGKVTAQGGNYGAGIGGGAYGNGSDITVTGGEVTANSGNYGAGIGGGANGIGSDVTISGDAQVKVQGGRANGNWHKGAAIGNGGTPTTEGNEVSPNTSDLTVEGFIQIYEPGKNINTDTPDKTIEGQKGDHSWNAGEVTAETVPESKAAAYWVCDPEGQSIPYQAQQKDGVLTVTVQADTASLRGTTGSLGQLEAQGIAEIRFVTNGAQSAFTLPDLLASGTGSFALTHAGDQVTCTLGDTDISSILK